MPNPMFSNATSPNGATSPNNPLNDSNKRYKRGYNRFNYNRTFYNTERYADINVIDVIEGVEGDKLPIGNKHDIRTFTLGSPIMFDVFKKKTYFMVDNKAILPLNWEKVYKQPNKGDDVSTSVNCVCSNLLYSTQQILNSLRENPHGPSEVEYNALWRLVFLLESIYSNGSLLSSMNCHLSSSIIVHDDSDNPTTTTFDSWLENLFSRYNDTGDNPFWLSVSFPSLSTDVVFHNFANIENQTNQIYLPLRQLLDMMRTFSDFQIYYLVQSYDERYNFLLKELSKLHIRFEVGASDEFDVLNCSRLVAYQLVCNQFYTNDSVDNIYNAELFMQNAKDHAQAFANYLEDNQWPRFKYNGTWTDYDVFSGLIIDKAFSAIVDFFGEGGVSAYRPMSYAYQYLHMLFFYRKSLRYGDYFVGAKTLPFAPGDVTADVVSGGVSALDMTRSILMQRFLNSVNRARNTWKDYLKDVTDGVAPPNPLEPRFLASTTSRVSGFEVENTAEKQGDIVTILKSGNSNYIYEVEVGEPCIIIGVSTYEVPRVYSKTVDRFFKHTDRFDMFNKFMQNIGDQEISLGERSSAFPWRSIFGYTPRHMEYKQRYPIASGGFVENLEGYAFITDNKKSGQNDSDYLLQIGSKISPWYIRNKNSEMDRFYKSLSGFGLASYFHFICKYDCICDASRQMEFNPTIL